MKITALVEALVAAGATPEMILAAVRTTESANETALEQAREKTRARVEKWRATKAGNVTDGHVTVSNCSREGVRREDKPLPQKRTQEESKKEEEDALSAPPSVAAALDAYSVMAGRAGLATPRVVTAARKARVAAILSEHGHAVWDEALAKVEASSFCRGQNERGWKADLDFILQPKTFPKILEGAYDDRRPQARAGPVVVPLKDSAANAAKRRLEALQNAERPREVDHHQPPPSLISLHAERTG